MEGNTCLCERERKKRENRIMWVNLVNVLADRKKLPAENV